MRVLIMLLLYLLQLPKELNDIHTSTCVILIALMFLSLKIDEVKNEVKDEIKKK